MKSHPISTTRGLVRDALWLRVILVSSVLTSLYRTDKAVLAVNGFAADGKVFVKRVQQRLEARTYLSVPNALL